MLANLGTPPWYFMEVPRTGTSTIERTLKHYFPEAKAAYQKHWPLLPPEQFVSNAHSIISVRNPFSRAVSCWQYFTKPGAYTFEQWVKERLDDGFFDMFIEARPQAFWYTLQDKWDTVIQQEHLQDHFHKLVQELCEDPDTFTLHRYNDINGQWVNRVKSRTSRKLPWQDYYTESTIAMVLQLYSVDFDLLGHVYSQKLPEYTP
jgi:hypothetical protein|tara:strand:- start:1971 stop:2582 length:612 start_codon:yes stop_codon:yes gene_type:complete